MSVGDLPATGDVPRPSAPAEPPGEPAVESSSADAAEEVARVRVRLAEAAAGATPLHELDQTAIDLTRVQPLLEQLASAVGNLLNTPMAVVWVLQPGSGELVPSAWVGLPDDYVAPLRVPVGTGTCGRAVLDGRPVEADVLTSPLYGEYRQGALDQGVRSVTSVPMLTLAGESVGALSAYFAGEVHLDDRRMSLLEVYARQAAEIVERARLHAEARQLAALERRRGQQLQELASAALSLSAADTLDELLRLSTDAAVRIVGCHQGVGTRLPHGWVDATTYVHLSESYARWRDYDVVPKGLGVLEYVVRENKPLRLTPEELVAHPDWRGLRDAPDHPPLPDYLAAPLIGRDGSNLGLLQLSHKLDDTPFTPEDEAILVQLAQMASSAVERLEALEGERRARREAEQAALIQALLSDASDAFSASLEPDEVLRTLLALFVPRFADWACVHLLAEDGTISLAGLRHADDDAEPAVRRFLEAFPITTDMPYGAGVVIASGEHQLFPEVPDEVLQALARDEQELDEMRAIVLRSGLIVPLTARGRTLGALSLMRDEPFQEGDVAYALDLARRASLAYDNASQYAFERELAATLQRSLLPRGMPASALLTSASRYLPGARGTQIGGDWYDLLEVDGGELVLVVGDVMGRGVQAAAVMGQLSATVRAYALEGHGPADVLTRLDRVVQAIEGLHFTTCIVGRLDPATRRLRIAAAGHLPPLVVSPASGGRFLELDPGLPLGVGVADFVEQEVVLDPGSLVMLYTDGLVEGPDCPVEEGMQRLLAALGGSPGRSAEEVCDRALQAMGRDGDHDDDTAVLALLLDDVARTGDAAPLVLDLPAVPESAAVARGALLDMLGSRRTAPAADTAALLVTELVGNAARHAGGDVMVRAGLRGELLLVEVHDGSEQLPRLRSGRDWEAESGRGILLVEALADRWGADALPSGKRVWFELLLDATSTEPMVRPTLEE